MELKCATNTETNKESKHRTNTQKLKSRTAAVNQSREPTLMTNGHNWSTDPTQKTRARKQSKEFAAAATVLLLLRVLLLLLLLRLRLLMQLRRRIRLRLRLRL